MNDVGGSESGNGLRAVKSSRTTSSSESSTILWDAIGEIDDKGQKQPKSVTPENSAYFEIQKLNPNNRSAHSNFEYDDSEWDVGIGNLIIDLDADIEKNNEASRSSTATTASSTATTATTRSATNTTSSATIKTCSSSSSQMHIPQSHSISGNTTTTSSTSSSVGGSNKGKAGSSGGIKPGTTGTGSTQEAGVGAGNLINASMDQSGSAGVGGEKGLKIKIKRTKPGTKSVDAKHEIVKSDAVTTTTTLGSGNTGVVTTSPTTTMAKTSNNEGQGAKTNQKGDERDTGGSDNGGKAKPPKRGSSSTHKKARSGASPAPMGMSPNKKDRITGPETGGSTNTNTKVNSNPSGNSSSINPKDMYNANLSIPSIAVPVGSGGSGPGSAFVKTTGLKVPGQGQTGEGGLIGGSYDMMKGSSRSYGNNTTGVNSAGSGQFGLNTLTGSGFSGVVSSTSGPITNLPAKGEKGQVTPTSVGLNTSTSSSEKITGISSPLSYSKKPRVFVQPEKNKWNQDDVGSAGTPQCPAGVSVTSPPEAPGSGHRSVNTGSLNNSNIVSGSSDSSVMYSGGSGSSGINNFGGNAKENTVPAQVARTGPPLCQDACVGTCVGTVTEPDCLGPCEPGTSVTLEGIVWHETENGVLVVNVTWRGKTYVGTLLDCTKNDWASPRFCDSPTSDLDIRNQKNRGKRGRAQAGTPVSDSGTQDTTKPSASKLRNGAKGRRGSASTSTAFVTPISPLKDPWLKRKTRGSENESQEESSSSGSNSVLAAMAAAAVATGTLSVAKAKRFKLSKDGVNFGRRANSPGISAGTGETSNSNSPVLIECPEPNCQKKYKHINGLRYHQSHAHSSHFTPEHDSDSNMSTTSTTNSVSVIGITNETPGPLTTTPALNSSAIIDPVEDDALTVGFDDSQMTLGEDSAASASSTPSTTPVKKQPVSGKTAEDLGGNSNAECDLSTTAPLNLNKDRDLPEVVTPLTIPMVPLTTPSKGRDEKMDTNVGKESQAPLVPSTSPPSIPPQPQLTNRPAILTVPNVPFMSLQNRGAQQMGGMLTVPRVLGQDQGQGPLVLTKSPRDTDMNVMSKTGALGSGPKSVPWQPHAHSTSSTPPHSHTLGLQHTAHVISSLHPQSSTTPLTVPQPQSQLTKDQSGNKDGKHSSGSINSATSALMGTAKKPKHKKKSKEKNERDREGKSNRDRDRGGIKGQNPSASVFQAGSSGGIGRAEFREKRKGSFEGVTEDGHGGMGSGENREDPQSPAYSDISDANDSGPESDMSLKESGGTGPKVSAPIPELKKDAVSTGGHGLSPFYPAFYSPYSLDSSPTSGPGGPNMNSNSAGKDRLAPGSQSEDIVSADKSSGKNSGGSGKPTTAPNPSTGPSHPLGPLHAHSHQSHGLLHGQHPEERRTSPKIDYHSKFLPPQHYYTYPYGNYHFDQPPYGLGISENPYAHNRVFMDDKERERELQLQQHGESHQLQQQRNRGDSSTSKRRASGDIREESGGLSTTIKQEQDFEQRTARGHKEQRHSDSRVQSHSHSDPKSDFGPDFNESSVSSKRSSMVGVSSHRQSSSASKRDREREERHARMKEAEGKESSQKGRSIQGDGSSGGRHGHGHKGSADSGPNESDKEKDQGSKPTMETQGPPPPPTAGQYAYIPQGYLPGNPFAISFEPPHPLYRQVLVPGHYSGTPYGMHGGGIPRFPPNTGSTPLPEDLSRPSGSGGGGGSAKALDLLQHHAAQYYASQHKIHELSERMKSPSPQVGVGVSNPTSGANSSGTGQPLGGPGLSSKPSSPSGLGIGIGTPLGRTIAQTGNGASGGAKPADLSSKDTKPPLGSLASAILGNESCRSPPTQHHVHSHTHHHTHVGIGYPIIPTVPPQYSPHYGVLSSPSPAAAPTVIPPFPSQKPN